MIKIRSEQEGQWQIVEEVVTEGTQFKPSRFFSELCRIWAGIYFLDTQCPCKDLVRAWVRAFTSWAISTGAQSSRCCRQSLVFVVYRFPHFGKVLSPDWICWVGQDQILVAMLPKTCCSNERNVKIRANAVTCAKRGRYVTDPIVPKQFSQFYFVEL